MVRKLLAPVAAGLLVLVTACSGDDDDPPADDTTTTVADDGGGQGADDTAVDDTGDDDAADEPAPDDTAADDAGDDDGAPDPDDVLGTSDARLAATPNDPTLVPLTLDVVALERLEGMVELRVVLSNTGSSRSPDYEPYTQFDDPRLANGQGTNSLSGASLVDADAQKAYLTIVDDEGTCLCTTNMDQVTVPPGESVAFYADFGGVPDDLDEVDVQVPGFPTVAAVPIG